MKKISISDEFQERLIIKEQFDVKSGFYSVVHASNIMNLFKEVTINLWFDRKANSSGSLAGMNKKSSLMKKLIRFYLIE